MEKSRPFLFRLTPIADKLLEVEYLRLKRKKSKSAIINEMILTTLIGGKKHDNAKSAQTPT